MVVAHLKSYYSYKAFDGTEGDFYKIAIKLPDDFHIQFSTNDVHDIEDLLPLIGEEDFRNVISSTEVAKLSEYFPNSYSGSDELPLGYVIKDDLLVLVSSGEFQPQRFKIYIEGVWKLEPK
jgi:hypothetical protein